MAGSRIEKLGTIFSRVQGLLKSGAMPAKDKPLWFDIYAEFPPHVEPMRLRPVFDKPLRPIFYAEDKIRAQFYDEFGSPGLMDLSKDNYKHLSQRFIEKYNEITVEEKNLTHEQVFTKCEQYFTNNGIKLRRDTPRSVESSS